MNWNNKKVLVTGGASFIGSHLCEQLVQRGAKVRVAENFSKVTCSILPFAIKQPMEWRLSFIWRPTTAGVDTSIPTPWNAPPT